MSPSTLRTLDLPSGGLLPFRSTPGERVRVLYGRVWLTAEGDTRDSFLASGEEVSVGGRGLAVIEALGPARIELIQTVRGPSPIAHAAAALVRRIRAALRRLAPRSPRPLRGAV
jgi:hypothetical protein